MVNSTANAAATPTIENSCQDLIDKMIKEPLEYIEKELFELPELMSSHISNRKETLHDACENVDNSIDKIQNCISTLESHIENLKTNYRNINQILLTKETLNCKMKEAQFNKNQAIETLDEVLITESAYRSICFGKVDDTYFSKSLDELSVKTVSFSTKNSQYFESEYLSKFNTLLTEVACLRIYDFLINVFESFKCYGSVNYQNSQKFLIDEFKIQVNFLSENWPVLLKKAIQIYEEILSKVLFHHIYKYFSELLKLIKPQNYGKFSLKTSDTINYSLASKSENLPPADQILHRYLLVNSIKDTAKIIIPQKSVLFDEDFLVETFFLSGLLVFFDNIEWELSFHQNIFNTPQKKCPKLIEQLESTTNIAFSSIKNIIDYSYDLPGLIICSQILSKCSKSFPYLLNAFKLEIKQLGQCISTRILKIIEKQSEDLLEYFIKQKIDTSETTLEKALEVGIYLSNIAFLNEVSELAPEFRTHVQNWLESSFLTIIGGVEMSVQSEKKFNSFIIANLVQNLLKNLDRMVKTTHSKIYSFVKQQLDSYLLAHLLKCAKNNAADIIGLEEKKLNLGTKENIIVFNQLAETLAKNLEKSWKEIIENIIKEVLSPPDISSTLKKTLVNYSKEYISKMFKNLTINLSGLHATFDLPTENDIYSFINNLTL